MAENNSVQSALDAINAQRQFIIDSFRGQVYLSDQLDVQDTPVYDTITYAAAATITTLNSQFFVNVGSNSGKSFVQTNVTQPKVLTAPEAFSVFGIRLYWDSTILRADLDSILQGFCFEFYLMSKYYQRAPIWHFAAGAGIGGMTTQTTESVYTNGSVERRDMHQLAIPLVIANQLSFYGQLFGSNFGLSESGAGFIMVCELVGLYARAVQ